MLPYQSTNEHKLEVELNVFVILLQKVTYPKTNDNSALRVNMHLAFRRSSTGSGRCTRWYLTFDGSECNNPTTIEMLDYNKKSSVVFRSNDSK